jgi:hypothetical protein
MPKFAKTAATACTGVAALAKLVASHGSIFRETPQQTDIGIDGYIEPVYHEIPAGCLVAVQVKSGASYLDSSGKNFNVSVSESHLHYWLSLPMPVLLVGYNPPTELLAAIVVQDYVERQRYHDRKILPITFSATSGLDHKFIDSLQPLCRRFIDQFNAVKYLDMCYAVDASDRQIGLAVITQHPNLRNSRVSMAICRALLGDTDPEVRSVAMYHLAYCAGRIRWSFNPNNKSEKDLSRFASELCRTLSGKEVDILLADVKDSPLWGPSSQLERLADIAACSEEALRRLEGIAENKSADADSRRTACWIACGASLDFVCDAIENGHDIARELWGDELSEFIDQDAANNTSHHL